MMFGWSIDFIIVLAGQEHMEPWTGNTGRFFLAVPSGGVIIQDTLLEMELRPQISKVRKSVVLLRPTCIEDIEVPCVSFGVCSYERYLDCRLQNHGNAQIVKHPSDFRSIPSIDIARVSCLKA